MYLILILWHDATLVVSSSGWSLFSFPLPLSPLHLSRSVLFTIFFLFLFFLFFLLLTAVVRRFCVCLPERGRKRSRKFICRDMASYSKTRMIYLHGVEGETGEMDLPGKGLSSVTRRGENAKCIFWKKCANPLSKPCGSSFAVFAFIRPMNSLGLSFRAWLKNVWREVKHNLFQHLIDLLIRYKRKILKIT